ncbi:hypothetical protein BT69DRAFT_302638 [Atractiella rhizophila]|nr:hypothetical protein BT69DRAFT_302638 [Atractiella rhizophila]
MSEVRRGFRGGRVGRAGAHLNAHAHNRNKSESLHNHSPNIWASSAGESDETPELKALRAKYAGEKLNTVKEFFPNWSEEDLLFVLQEAGGDLELAIARISEGHAQQWSSAKTKKPKKDANSSALPSDSFNDLSGGFSESGRGRGRGGSRGGRGGFEGRGRGRGGGASSLSRSLVHQEDVFRVATDGFRGGRGGGRGRGRGRENGSASHSATPSQDLAAVDGGAWGETSSAAPGTPNGEASSEVNGGWAGDAVADAPEPPVESSAGWGEGVGATATPPPTTGDGAGWDSTAPTAKATEVGGGAWNESESTTVTTSAGEGKPNANGTAKFKTIPKGATISWAQIAETASNAAATATTRRS